MLIKHDSNSSWSFYSHKTFFLTLLFIFTISVCPGFGKVFRVDSRAAAGGDGATWESAFHSIQDAVDATIDYNGGEIWVAVGTYKGTGDNTVVMKTNIEIYGGFAGIELSREERNWRVYQSIIDGDFVRRCLYFENLENMIVDGFYIKQGYAGYYADNDLQNGGGIYCKGSTVSFKNCHLSDNRAHEDGGGLYSIGSSLTVSECMVLSNTASYGGGIYSDDGVCIIERCIIKNNIASSSGGGACNKGSSESVITNCIFDGNLGWYYGGGLRLISDDIVTNCLFINNISGYNGGGVCFSYSPTIKNCIFKENSTGIETLSHSTDSIITNNCLQNYEGGEDNIYDDPMLNPITYCPLPNSPCIDSGDMVESVVINRDLNGNPRIQGLSIDMGPYEYKPGSTTVPLMITLGPDEISPLNAAWGINHQTDLPSGKQIEVYPGNYQLSFSRLGNWKRPLVTEVTVSPRKQNEISFNYSSFPGSNLIYVDCDAIGINDGSSWTNAFTNIQEAIDAIPDNTFKELWIADGFYGDTNDCVMDLKKDLAIFGGFSGVESIRNERDWKRNSTYIDGEHSRRCINNRSSSLLDGLTIINGFEQEANEIYQSGGGINSRFGSPTFQNCTIRNNTTGSFGGGVCLIYNRATMTNCYIVTNTSYRIAGGLFNSMSITTLNNCIIADNQSDEYGAGFHNNTVLDLNNCTIVNNTSAINSGYGGGGPSALTTISNCIIWGNNTEMDNTPQRFNITYSCLDDSIDADGEGNIYIGPLFDQATYRLLEGSPCIDSGDPISSNHLNVDLAGTNRIHNNRIDMGSYERNPLSQSVLVSINLGPEEIEGHFPQWRIDHGPWSNNNQEVKLYPGTYMIEYTGHADWEKPEQKFIIVNENTTQLQLNYSSTPGLNRWYVDELATGASNGKSWGDAFTAIQKGIDHASFQFGGEIWVSKGTYKRTHKKGIVLRDKINIYGGFDGMETQLDHRDWWQNKSVINGENGEHIIRGAKKTRLDGFIVKECANWHSLHYGSAMYNINSSMIIENCIFKNNRSDQNNIYSYLSSVTFNECIFTENRAKVILNNRSKATFTNCSFFKNDGFAIGNYYSTGTIKKCHFDQNTTGVYNSFSSPEISNCRFTNNSTEYSGAGVCNTENSTPRIIGCLFTGNYAEVSGSAIYNRDGSSTEIVNCTFLNNTALEYDSIISSSGGTDTTIKNSIIWDNSIITASDSPKITYSCVEGGYPGEGNIDSDPLLEPFSPCRPLPISPCIDTGNNTIDDLLPADDLLGNARVYNTQIDMGAIEYNDDFSVIKLTIELGPDEIGELAPRWQLNDSSWFENGETIDLYPGEYSISYTPFTNWQEPSTSILTVPEEDLSLRLVYSHSPGNYLWYVDQHATGDNNGLSWANAFVSIDEALDTLTEVDYCELWVSKGIYTRSINLDKTRHLYGGFAGGEATFSDRNWVLNETIIDATLKCTDDAILDGFIIQNNEQTAMYIKTSSPEIRNCHFRNNNMNYRSDGGAFRLYYSSPIISNCIISNNNSQEGGGIFSDHSTPIITNCLFTENGARYGSGVYSYGGEAIIKNCIFWDNTTYQRDVISGLTTVSYSCVEGGHAGTGNIDLDPMLEEVNRYIMLPNSPCIDAGDPDDENSSSTDYVQSPRVQNNRIDMGPFEYTPDTRSVMVTINLGPDEIEYANPRWKLDDGPWYESGETIELYPRDLSIEFSKALNWTVPAISLLNIPEQDVTFNLNYQSTPGRFRWYVDVNAQGEGTGNSWENAFTNIQSAVDRAALDGLGEIWVSKGIYTETDSAVIESKGEVSVYGGFQGTETSVNDRNYLLNSTVLKSINNDPSKNCVSCLHDITLDGFVIDYYKKTQSHASINIGNSSPVIKNCYFRNNYDENTSYAISSYMATPCIINCIFDGFTPILKPGAIYNKLSSPIILNCIFSNNSTKTQGGAIFNQGSDSIITNCTFYNNTAEMGGNQIYNNYSDSIITNCIFKGQNDSIGNESSVPSINNCCFESLYEGVRNIISNPLFVDPAHGDFRLLPESACIDSGTSDGAPVFDIRGVLRPQGNEVDMGAYEYQNGDPTHRPGTTLLEYDFPIQNNGGGWVFHRPDQYRDVEGFFDTTGSTWDMTLTNNEMSFGYMESPLVSIVGNESLPLAGNNIVGKIGNDQLYRATYFVASDLEDVSEMPVIRLRVSSESFHRSDVTVVSSESLAELSPGINGRFYTTYFQMPENESNFRLDLDVLSFDPRDSKQATISLHYAEVEYLGSVDDLPGRVSVLSRDFSDEGPSGWEHYPTNPIDIPSPGTFSSGIGKGLLIRGSEPVRQEGELPIAMFGYWGGEMTEYPLQRSLYRVVWHIGSDVDIDRITQLPTFRLRFNDETMKFASITNIDSTEENNWLPSVNNPVLYSSWFEVPAEITGNNWELSFDYLFVDKPAPDTDDPTAALMLYALDVFRYDIP